MIILASTSPRRKELLSRAGLSFDVMPVDIDESILSGENAKTYIERMVRTKSEVAIKRLNSDVQSLVICADTIGVMPSGEILTKPKNKAHAIAMWQKLSNNHHQIWTAVCLTLLKNGAVKKQEFLYNKTDVYFTKIEHDEMERYWASGEPLDKAGAYAIQGGAMAWVEKIEGSYTNVIGLPLSQTLAAIKNILAQQDENPSGI